LSGAAGFIAGRPNNTPSPINNDQQRGKDAAQSAQLAGMTLRTRMSRSLSAGAHSRAPLAHPGYACFKKIKQRRRVATRHDWLAAIYLASSNLHPFGFRHSLSSPRYRPRSKD
jgi:hypothetical protein